MSSCSDPMMDTTISCSELVLDSTERSVPNCREDIEDIPDTKEIESLVSSAENRNEETSLSSKSSAFEGEDDAQMMMICSDERAAQSVSCAYRENVDESNLEHTIDVGSRRSVEFKHQISVNRRSAIVTRLDGVNSATGSDVSFYKCHLCGKLFGRLSDVPMHLSVHSPQQMTLYQCLLCEGSFSFKTKLLQHLRMHHNVNLPRRVRISETDGFSLDSKGSLDRINAADCGSKSISQKNEESLQSTASMEPRVSKESSEISNSKSDEESGMSSTSQSETLHRSVETSDRIPEDRIILDKLDFDKLSDGYENFFRCDPVKGLTKTNSFLCQICGFESWRQQRLLHHVIKHHLDSVTVQKMRKQFLHRRKRQSPYRTSESGVLRKFGNCRELKTVLSETRNCPTSSADESCNVTSETPNVECKGDPLSSSVPPTTTNCFTECFDGVLAVQSDPVSNKTEDMQELQSTNYSGSSQTTDHIKNINLAMSPVTSLVNTEQLKLMDNKAVCSSFPLVSMDTTSSICNMIQQQANTTIPSSSSMSSLITVHEARSESRPLVFSPSNVSPLLRGFLPLPLLSFFVNQSALNPTSFLSTSDSNSQFSSDQVQTQKQSFDEKFSSSLVSNSWDPCQKFEATREEDIKPDREELDWRVMVRNRPKGLASRASSTLKDKCNSGNDEDQNLETFKPIITSDGQAVYRCTYCSKDFSTASDITRHMEFHEDIRPYKCTHCDYHARTNSQLKVHMMRHQGIRKFHCRLCNYKGVTQSDLNRHAKSQIHLLKARNQCESCGEGFVSPINLGKHFQDRHFGQKTEESLDLDQ